MPRRRNWKNAGMTQPEKVVLSELAKGEVTLATNYTSGVTATQSTEVTNWSSGSATERVIFPYLKLKQWVWSPTQNLYIRWAIVKTESAATPDLTSDTVLEGLMREKRILRRGELVQNYGDDIKPIGATLFAVSLEEGEYIYFTWVNLSATKTDCKVCELYEYRKIIPSG